MKKKMFLRIIPFVAIMSIAFAACKDDPPAIAEAKITAFKITNAGANGNTTVEGVIDNLNILVVVPFETNLSALTPDITVSTGAAVTPGSGVAVDFSTPRNFIVVNGPLTSTYTVTVTKAAPTSGVITAIEFRGSVSNIIYPSVINQATRTITVTFNQLQSPNVVLSSITLLPAGATYTTSGDGNNLNLSTAQTITVSFAGTNTAYNVVANVTAAGFNPANTTLLMDRSARAGLVPSAIDNELTRSAAFDGRFVYLASRKEGNFVYAWDVETPTANPIVLDFGGVVAGGTWVVSDVRCEEGKIYVSNMVMNQDQVFRVYKWNDRNSTPQVILQYTIPGAGIRLGDAISIIGNPPENGYIFASNFAWPNHASEFYVWNFNGGNTNPTPTLLPIVPTSALRMGQYGRVSAIPGEPDKLLVTGAELVLGVINFNGTFLYEATEPMIQSRSFDYRVFSYNDGRYLSYVVNREWEASTSSSAGVFYDVINISEGEGIIQALRNLNNNNITQKRVFRFGFGAAAAQWVGATHQVGFGSNGRPRAMSFAIRSGFVVHQFSH